MVRRSVHEISPEMGFDPAKVRYTFYRYMSTANPTIFVAELDGRLVGYLNANIAEYDYTHGLYVVQRVLYVQPEHRGTRAAAGARLFRHFVQWADRLGAREIVGGNDNGVMSESTKRLLERFGFKQVGYAMKRSAGGNGRQI